MAESREAASTPQPGSEQRRPLVELRELTLRFGRQTILDHISLEVPVGQTLVIIGESGCGKTMLLKSIVGLVRPTSGQVLYDGMDIHRLSEMEMTEVRRRHGFVFQNAALFDSMTVGENVAFPLVHHHIASGRRLWRIVSDRLAEVGLPDTVIPKRPAELSGGMRKRVGLARALALNPELILYDEPTTGLDPIMSDVINELMIRTRQSKGVTSIIITHDMRTAYKVADRVVMLYPQHRLSRGESQILFDGPPSELESCDDRRVRQFVLGEAGERLMEMRMATLDAYRDTPDLADKYPR
ncbi:MAG: ABC transporter ATP-binding protein [Pirellulaceae bacterium]|nr:MAG: ABC transporter ATP-binding protein [Pirellulaceae bacterium]